MKAVTKSLSEGATRAEQAINVALESGVEAGVHEWQNPACTDPSDPDCIKRAPSGGQEILDEYGNVIGHRPAGGYNKDEAP